MQPLPHISIAPMLDWSDRHYRFFMRQITKHTLLYTEMVVADAIIHGKKERLLGFDLEELPVIAQIGGSDPVKLALASKEMSKYGYSGVNLNVGCPSDRVKSGNFGACLMQEPKLVAECIKAMQDAVTIPVSIKQRIGINYNYEYGYLSDFVFQVAETGCKDFIIHARNAVLTGLSPKQNREIPPLKYDFVYKLKQDFPALNIVINGGIKTLAEIDMHLAHVDGVMLGREAYYNPYLFSTVDQTYFNAPTTILTRNEIALLMEDYLIKMHNKGVKLHHITRHMLGLYYGCAHAKLWRHTLAQEVLKTNSVDTYSNLLKIIA